MLSINGPLSIDAVGGSADGVHPRGFDALMSIDVGLLVLRAVQPVLALRAAEQQELAGGGGELSTASLRTVCAWFQVGLACRPAAAFLVLIRRFLPVCAGRL